jgi:hypothetical protein
VHDLTLKIGKFNIIMIYKGEMPYSGRNKVWSCGTA